MSQPTIVCLVPDLFFATRFEDVIRAAGGAPVLVDDAEALIVAVDRTFPVLVLIDLDAPGDWAFAIRRIKTRPHSRQIPVYAFGSHVDTATLRAARAAGADHAWARSKMAADLVDVVQRHVSPPVRYPAGWDDRLSAKALEGVHEFNRGEFFEQHELFEEAWLEEPRPIREMYQGILQVGVAFYLIEQDNWAGAVKMFRRGLPRLRDLPDVCQGINIAALRTAAERIHAEISALGPARLGEFDRTQFPRIELVDESDQPHAAGAEPA